MNKIECLRHIRKAIAMCAAWNYFGDCINNSIDTLSPLHYDPAGLVLKDILDFIQMHEEIVLHDDYEEALKHWYQMDTNIRDYLSVEAVNFMQSQVAE